MPQVCLPSYFLFYVFDRFFYLLIWFILTQRFEQPKPNTAPTTTSTTTLGTATPLVFGSLGGIDDADDAAWWQRRYAVPGPADLDDALSEESDSEHDPEDDDDVPPAPMPAPSPGRPVRSAAGTGGRTPLRPATGTATARSQLRAAYVTGRCDSDNNE